MGGDWSIRFDLFTQQLETELTASNAGLEAAKNDLAETKNALSKLVSDYSEAVAGETEMEELLRLRNELAEAKEQRDQLKRASDAVQKYLFADDSDSIIAACNCDTKTNEIKHHKKGCKYRLICERDGFKSTLTELLEVAERLETFGTNEPGMLTDYLDTCEDLARIKQQREERK
jgi:chromosome segregation ATPase